MSLWGRRAPDSPLRASDVLGPGAAVFPRLDGSNLPFLVKVGAYTVTAADAGRTILGSGASWTLGLPAVASVPVGFPVRLINDDYNVITVDPNGAETIDGAATREFYYAQSGWIISTGTSWRVLWDEQGPTFFAKTIAASDANCVVRLPAGYSGFEIDLNNIRHTAVGYSLLFRIATDGVPSFISSAAYYNRLGLYTLSSTGTVSGVSDNNSSGILSSSLDDSSGALPLRSKIMIDVLSGQTRYRSLSSFRSSAPAVEQNDLSFWTNNNNLRPTHIVFLPNGTTFASGRVQARGII